jgi:hypothetical protein
MGGHLTLYQPNFMLIPRKQTTDTAENTLQPAMERKAGQKQEAFWKDHNKEARTLLVGAEYDRPFSIVRNME